MSDCIKTGKLESSTNKNYEDSLFPLFPVPCSLFPVPCSLLQTVYLA
ncbi:MAG: hypothetical protein F6J90_09370 [Moorea sp. SIOASIH]|nr:hypothetical protein [Moorena sp. SIOASIH]NEO36520.1 hypothetical protein [Moorena sp. SIOASIH]